MHASSFNVLQRFLLTGLLAASISCASKTPKPDDMSKEGHQAEAAKEDAAAAEHRAKYDPNAVVITPTARLDTPVDMTRNPTDSELQAAQVHERHAQEHRAAAASLEKFEDTQCAGVPKPQRGTCPLLFQVQRTDLTAGGVKLQLVPGANVDETMRQVQCHLAYSRSEHHEAVAECSLYIAGVAAARSADGKSIELLASDPKVLAELQRRANEHKATAAAGK